RGGPGSRGAVWIATRRHRRAALATLGALLIALGAGGGCELLVGVDQLNDGRCPADEKPCPGENRCVRRDAPNTGCASESSCAPCTFPHATARCEDDGQCHLSMCIGS